jgi:N12 class adenine-specific DNA methylase
MANSGIDELTLDLFGRSTIPESHEEEVSHDSINGSESAQPSEGFLAGEPAGLVSAAAGRSESGTNPVRRRRANTRRSSGTGRKRDDDGRGKGNRASQISVSGDSGLELTDDQKKRFAERDLGPLFGEDAVPLPKPKRAEVRSPGTLIGGHTDKFGEYHITTEDNIGAGGPVAKFEANLKAIILVKLLAQQKRFASSEEQAALVQYTGWGGIPKVFEENLEDGSPWKARQDLLQQNVTENEYERLRASTLNAHYTVPYIAKTMWNVVERFGFRGGPAIDPATGTGIFLGVRPKNENIAMTAVEIDPISGQIARQLQQNSQIKVMGYEDYVQPANHFNLAISNVPFGKYNIRESKKNKTPGIDRAYPIHDYFFLKAINGLTPGGVAAFITSRYTLDKLDTQVREKIAENADFVGAIRLPRTAFKQIANTEVITDMVFLQKREVGKEMSDLTRSFLSTGKLSLEDKDGSTHEIDVNQYYLDHPEMVVGKQELTRGLYKEHEYSVYADEDAIKAELAQTASLLPSGIMNLAVDRNTQRLTDLTGNTYDIEDNRPPGTLRLAEDGVILYKDDQSMTYLPYEKARGEKTKARLVAMITMRDLLHGAFSAHVDGDEITAHHRLEELNTAYDEFVSSFGYINERTNIRTYAIDPEITLLQALENWDSIDKVATKSDLLLNLKFNRYEVPPQVDTPIEALIVSLTQYARIDLDFMAELLPQMDKQTMTERLVEDQIIFPDPEQFLEEGELRYLTADEYLSGNVREKLKTAKKAASIDGQTFTRNAEAMSKVIPRDLTADEILLQINHPIIEEEHVAQFVREHFDPFGQTVEVEHLRELASWDVRFDSSYSIMTEKWGTHDKPADKLINDIMNGRPIQVQRTEQGTAPDGSKYTRRWIDEKASYAAQLKAEEIDIAFKGWVFSDADRREYLVKKYNEIHNANVAPQYIHPLRRIDPNAQIYLPGSSFPFPLRDHQADIVWRTVMQKSIMAAHVVGSGKTLSIASSAMELRRLGLRNKIMIVVPDHLLEQWVGEFRMAYPAAKILAGSKDQTKNRSLFANKIITGDWDAVIIRMSTFTAIPAGKGLGEYITKRLAELRRLLATFEGDEKRDFSVKQIEAKIKSYEERLERITEKTDELEGVIPFDQMGIDQLYLDEAHAVKNLEYETKLRNVKGLGTPAGSKRSLDMLVKAKHIQKIGGGVVFATGTPVSNSLVESHTMMRFLQPETLEEIGIEQFDEFERAFAEKTSDFEMKFTGTGYKQVTRFKSIKNVQDLLALLHQAWDIQTHKNLEEKGILVPGKNLPLIDRKTVVVDAHPLLKSYMRDLERREKEIKRPQKGEKGLDNALKIMGDGMKASVDLRFIHPDIPATDSKLEACARGVYERYVKHNEERLTQVVFFDRPQVKNDEGEVVFDGVSLIRDRLIEMGIPADEIGDMRTADTDTKKQMIYDRMNKGDMRILFGSGQNMGAGVNVQRRLKTLHHLRPDYTPMMQNQKDGRINRPGNSNEEIEIVRYSTAGSLDVGLYNLLSIKDQAITAIMDGSDTTTRRIEEDVFASVRELTTDNPHIKEFFQLQTDIKRLSAQRESHNASIGRAKSTLQAIPDHIKREQDQIAGWQEFINSRHPMPTGDSFTMEVEGKVLDKRKDAGIKLLEGVHTFIEKWNAGNKNLSGELLGSYAGVSLRVMKSPYSTVLAKIAIESGQMSLSCEVQKEQDPVGLVMRIHNTLYKQPELRIDQSRQHIQAMEADRVTYKALVENPFGPAAELTEKRARLEVLQEILAKEESENEQQKREYDFPWEKLADLNKDQIQLAYDRFMAEEISLEASRRKSKAAREANLNIPDEPTLRDRLVSEFGINLPTIKGMGKLSSADLNKVYEDVKTYFTTTEFSWVHSSDGSQMLVPSQRSSDAPHMYVTEHEGTYQVFMAGSEQPLGQGRDFDQIERSCRRTVHTAVAVKKVRSRIKALSQEFEMAER